MNPFGWDLPMGCTTADIDRRSKNKEETEMCPDCAGQGFINHGRCDTCKGEGEVPVTTEDIEDRKADAADHERDVEQGN
jgi:DnaJ-class molecular chaperone